MKNAIAPALLSVAALFVAAKATQATYRAPSGRAIASEPMVLETAGLKIPFFYAVPKTSMLDNQLAAIEPDQIIDAVHADSLNPANPIGLRLYKAGTRKGIGERLVKNGFLRTGDVILTFRPAWGGAGPYANLQMGISHTGMVMAINNHLYNVDNPLSSEYLDPKGDLSSEHYLGTRYLHILRPRLTDAERANLENWGSTLFQSTFPAPGVKLRHIYQDSLEFNPNYGDPRIIKDKQLGFVRDLGRMVFRAKGIQMPAANQALFCSEFAWSIFALRGCDPDDPAIVAQFQGKEIPSCIKPIFEPLKVTGTAALEPGPDSTIGLAEGPLLIIDSMVANLPAGDSASASVRDGLVSQVFPPSREGELPGSVMSVGHKGVAKAMADGGLFKALEIYYRATAANPDQARSLSDRIVSATPANYSPASYMLNSLLPPESHNRAFDYVTTLDLGSGN